MSFDYDKSALAASYKKVGLESGRVVYLTGNFGALGKYEQDDKTELLRAHLDVITSLIGVEGTLVVPTHSWSLCNTNKVFDLAKTPSESGIFTEYVRCLPGAIRQFHPFSSSTAYGAASNFICTNNSLHVYGLRSPFSRMIEADAIHVSVGMPVNKTISLVHHVELMMGVPYRYTKEFSHPCMVDGEIALKEFYLYVKRRDVDTKRVKRNMHIMEFFATKHEIKSSRLGRSSIHSVEQRELFDSTAELFSKNIYAWLDSPPKNRDSYTQ